MEKKFTKFELAKMKRTAQNVDQFINKKNKLNEKITALQEELNSVNQLIEIADALTKTMTGGYGTEDIIKKVVTPTNKLDKNGNVIKDTSYVFKYPDTIIPPCEEIIPPCEETAPVEEEVVGEEVYTGVINEQL